MTKEEAILILEEEAEFLYGGDEPYNKIAFDIAIEALSNDTVSREWYDDAVKANHELAFTDLPDIPRYYYEKVVGKMAHEINMLKEQLESANAEPKWTCTANFVAEQLDRLRKMTDEEKWNFFREFFGMGDAVQGEWIKHKGEWVDLDFYPTKYECSQCHYCVDEGYDSIFCPNCGARMRGGDTE